MHYLDKRIINFDFSKDTLCDYFVHPTLPSKTQSFILNKYSKHILNLCSIYKLHVKLNYKGFLKAPILVTADGKRGKST